MNPDELFEKFPDLVFRSFRQQMLLGMVPASTVRSVLEPLVSNFFEVMLGLPSDLQSDFQDILRIYPDVAARFGLRMKPPLAKALLSLAERLSRENREPRTGTGGDTPSEFDLAAEGQRQLSDTERRPLYEGQGFFTTDADNPVYVEFTYFEGDEFLSFRCHSSQDEIEVHVFGNPLVTLQAEATRTSVAVENLVAAFERKKLPVDFIRLVEKPAR